MTDSSSESSNSDATGRRHLPNPLISEPALPLVGSPWFEIGTSFPELDDEKSGADGGEVQSPAESSSSDEARPSGDRPTPRQRRW